MGKLTASIPEDLHQRVRDEVAADETLTTSMVVQRAIEAYYSKGASKMNENTKTLAFQIPQELFDRIQDYLAARRQQTDQKLTQKGFIVGLINRRWRSGSTHRRKTKIVIGSPAQVGAVSDFWR